MTARERLQAALGAYDGTLDAAEHRATHAHEYEPSDADTAAADDRTDGDRNAPAPSYDGPAFRDAAIARSFMLGGRAIFTLVSEATGTRYTYRVAQGKPRPGDSRPAPFFVSLLTGPDNTSEYTYMGMLDPSSGAVRLTRASQYTADTVPVRALDWCMRIVFSGRVPAGVRIYHCGRCARCGRLLTVPTSIESGFGPECLAKMGGAQ